MSRPAHIARDASLVAAALLGAACAAPPPAPRLEPAPRAPVEGPTIGGEPNHRQSVTLQARGNEPFWLLDIGATLRLRTPSATLEGPAPSPLLDGDTQLYHGQLEGRPIRVAARTQRCSDTMTGMPYPLTVEMHFDGRTWRGCGGSPADLLVGPEWVVKDIGSGVIDGPRATLAFAADGRLSGRAPCNRYTTTWTLTGETLTMARPASTMMACAPGLMQQEARFLDMLQNTRRFEITENGALILVTGDERRIVAQRAK